MPLSRINPLVAVFSACVFVVASGHVIAQDQAPSAQPPAAATDAAAADKPAPRIAVTISKETTYITEPLRPDGYPDYIRYLDKKLSRGVTPQNNAAVALVRVLGPREISGKHAAEFYKRLGIEPVPEKGDYLVDWTTFSARFSAKDWPAVPPGDNRDVKEYFQSLDDVARSRPWTREELPAPAQWLDANDKHIDRLVAASRRPRMYAPVIASDEGQTLVSVLLPVVQSNRTAARALAARAMYRAGGNDIDGAIEDLMACHRLARLTGQGFTLVEMLVAIAVDHIALDAEAALISENRLNARQRAALRKQLNELPPMQSMADRLDQGERLMYLDSVCWIARSGTSELTKLTGMVSTSAPGAVDLLANLAGDVLIDWDVPLKVGNEWYDRYVAAARIKDAKERLKALDAMEADLKDAAANVGGTSSLFGLILSPRQAASQKMANVFIALLLPALNAALNAEHRNEAKHSLVRLGLALADYRDEHGSSPDKLDALAPKYIEKVPLDPMWGEPFVYKKSDRGAVLYGLGVNGKDDGGRTFEENDGSDDLVISVPAKKAAEQKR